MNGRWAMLGVAGMLIPEVLTKAGLINAPQWYDAGKSEYFASSSTLFVIEFILFHYVEIRRWQDIKNPGSVNQDPIFKSYSLPPHECGYPGSVFNPLNFAPTLEAKEKELANGEYRTIAPPPPPAGELIPAPSHPGEMHATNRIPGGSAVHVRVLQGGWRCWRSWGS